MVLIKLGETFWTGFYIKYVMLIIYLLGDTSHKIPDPKLINNSLYFLSFCHFFIILMLVYSYLKK